MGDIHPLGNPHIQLDPRNIAAVAKALAAKLAAVDPAGRRRTTPRAAPISTERWTEAIGALAERKRRRSRTCRS